MATRPVVPLRAPLALQYRKTKNRVCTGQWWGKEASHKATSRVNSFEAIISTYITFSLRPLEDPVRVELEVVPSELCVFGGARRPGGRDNLTSIPSKL